MSPALPDVAVGDEVVLMGTDASGNCIHAEELATWAGTIPYEIFCGISKRVPTRVVFLKRSKYHRYPWPAHTLSELSVTGSLVNKGEFT